MWQLSIAQKFNGKIGHLDLLPGSAQNYKKCTIFWGNTMGGERSMERRHTPVFLSSTLGAPTFCSIYFCK